MCLRVLVVYIQVPGTPFFAYSIDLFATHSLRQQLDPLGCIWLGFRLSRSTNEQEAIKSIEFIILG